MERAELPPVFLCARYRHHRHMKSVLILYSGQSGHTRAMCDAAVAGAATQSADVTVRCLYAPDAGLDDLLWADSRPEERRVGKECVSTWRSRRARDHLKKHNKY